MIINHTTTYIDVGTALTHTISTKDEYDYLQYSASSDNTTNICSTSYDPDRELASMLNMEIWNSFGVELTYYGTTYDTSYDKIFGEDGNRVVNSSWNIMSYFPLPKENKIWGEFGIEGVNDFSMYVSKEHFRYSTSGYIPKMGDLVISLYDQKLYEILEIKEEAPLFLLSKQYAWEFIVRKAKIEQDISVSPTLSASSITKYYNVSDIFNIDDQIDIEKENILYEPDTTETPVNDPFGTW